jgi:hypothetical protein
MVVGLGGYTSATFNATVQAAFVAGISILGGFETDRVEVTAVTDDPGRRRALLQTVRELAHVEARREDGRFGRSIAHKRNHI